MTWARFIQNKVHQAAVNLISDTVNKSVLYVFWISFKENWIEWYA